MCGGAEELYDGAVGWLCGMPDVTRDSCGMTLRAMGHVPGTGEIYETGTGRYGWGRAGEVDSSGPGVGAVG